MSNQPEPHNFPDAARAGDNATIIKFLDEYGVRFINEKNGAGYTALMLAAMGGHIDTLELLLKGNARIDERDSEGKTALMHATCYAHKEAVVLLLDKGADIEAKDTFQGASVLMWGVGSGNFQIVELLLERGADIKAKDIHGDTALEWARSCVPLSADIEALLRQWPEECKKREQKKKERKGEAQTRTAGLAESRRKKLKEHRPVSSPFRQKPSRTF